MWKDISVTIYIEIPTVLAAQTGGRKSLTATGSNLGEALIDLEARHPGFRNRLVNDDGRLRKYINVYINDDNVRFGSALESPLADGDVVSIIPAVAGGA